MKQWVKKLIEQFELDKPAGKVDSSSAELDISENRATLLYIIDSYSKHLIEIDSRPVRKVREIFDEFAKGLLKPSSPNSDKILFRFRQFFSAYRIQETTYIEKTFEDFKSIVWDFADQLNESVKTEQNRDVQVRESLEQLREAVEANSIEELKTKSREFIDFYIELQTRNDEARSSRLESVQKNLASVKKKLTEVKETANTDHLTGAYNRRFFDDKIKSCADLFKSKKTPVTIMSLDIDYFKKVNDIFGHDAGDAVLKELVKLLKDKIANDKSSVCRVGGEEFAVVLPETSVLEAVMAAEIVLDAVRKTVVVHSDTQIRFTVSIGIAQLNDSETTEKWVKRADTALYQSKESGRDQYTVAPNETDRKVAS